MIHDLTQAHRLIRQGGTTAEALIEAPIASARSPACADAVLATSCDDLFDVAGDETAAGSTLRDDAVPSAAFAIEAVLAGRGGFT